MTLLAIESSCDETAAAVLDPGPRVRSSIVSTQVERHAPFGGVVPEIASREHMLTIERVVDEALQKADATLDDVTAIGVTTGPGLIGALFVGVLYAKGLALARKLPLIAVNHLEGHLAASDLLATPAPFPHIALLVSGGHTALYRVDGPFSVKTLATTLDDAAGEAFDKTAKLLGLGYPGGAKLSRAAQGGDATIALPVAMKDRLDFSFSGLKTAVATYVQKHGVPGDLRDICFSIENAIVSALVQKALAACDQERVSALVVGGGVAANGPLRERIAAAVEARGGKAYIPERAFCTDNAAMIGAAALRRLNAGKVADLACAPRAYWPLSEAFA